MGKPLIIITGQTEVDEEAYGVKRRWADALAACDAIPAIVPPIIDDEGLGELLDIADGIMIPGGSDVDPHLFGEEQLDATRELAPLRDRFESKVITEAIGRDIPLLAVCRGLQLMNVLFGGTLNQRLDDNPNYIEHWQPEPYDIPSHTIEVTEGTILARIMGAGAHEVNSMHDQGPGIIAPLLNVSAVAEDGVVEALEHPSARFCLAIQWHPEFMMENAPQQRRILEAFVEECKKQ